VNGVVALVIGEQDEHMGQGGSGIGVGDGGCVCVDHGASCAVAPFAHAAARSDKQQKNSTDA
jgi:hypothetical protein